MARLFRVRDKILLGLALGADILQEIKRGGGIAASAYEKMHGFVPDDYKQSNLYATVYRMLNADLLEKVVENGTPKFRVTSFGRKKIIRDFPLIAMQEKKWDKKWRIVIFDIEERVRWVRDALRKKLIELGFGMVQKSVWISPHPFDQDVNDFIKVKELSKFAYVFVTNKFYTGNTKKFVEKIWKTDKLETKYLKLIEEFEENEENKGAIEVFKRDYLELLSKDPFIPYELMTNPHIIKEARELFKKL